MGSTPHKREGRAEKARIERNGESRLPVRAVSRGVAIGPACLLNGSEAAPERRQLESGELTTEIQKLKKAFSTARRQLLALSLPDAGEAPASRRAIFDSHLAILDDPFFLPSICETVSRERVNAEWAVRAIAGKHAGLLAQASDQHLREKAEDIVDVANRVVGALQHRRKSKLPKGAVVLTSEVNPSAIMDFVKQGVAGIIAEVGGWTSHSFIIAREAEIPAVVGVKGGHRLVGDGETVIVDGFRGELIVRPTAATLAAYESEGGDSVEIIPPRGRKHRSQTLDGHDIRIRMNLDPVRGVREMDCGDAQGIGLFRSEMLYDDVSGFPSESKQLAAYERALLAAGKWGAIVRTFDLSHDRVFKTAGEEERNPSLGLRGTRLMLDLPSQFRKQIRALLKSSSQGKLGILLPMISDVEEIRTVRSIIRSESARLKANGFKVRRPKLGAMVEIPSAVLVARELLAEVDFVNLGTNDLVQYLLGVDRDNGGASGFFRTLHPAVLRAIKHVVDEGIRARKPVIVCGEMAGSPAYVGVLIGLGVSDISVGRNSVSKVKRVVEGLAEEECRSAVERMLACSTASQAEKIWESEFGERLRALVPNLSFQAKPLKNKA